MRGRVSILVIIGAAGMDSKWMTVGKRLGWGFGLMLGVMLLISVAGNWQLAHNTEQMRQLVQERLRSERTLEDFVLLAQMQALQANQIKRTNPARDAAIQGPALAARIHNLQQELQAARLPAEVFLQLQRVLAQGQIWQAAQANEGAPEGSRDDNLALSKYLQALQDLRDSQRTVSDQLGYGQLRAMEENRDFLLLASLAAIALVSTFCLYLIHILCRQLGTDPRHASAISQTIADGDLTMPIHSAANDQHSLLYSLRVMRDRLALILQQMNQGVQHLVQAARAMHEEQQALHAHSRSQHGKLQQAARAAQEVTRSMGTQHAVVQQALQQVGTCAQGMQACGPALQGMQNMLADLHGNAQQIETRLGVIDQLAFQANVLALNAAAEAARLHTPALDDVAGRAQALAQASSQARQELLDLLKPCLLAVEQGAACLKKLDLVRDVQHMQQLERHLQSMGAERELQLYALHQVQQALRELEKLNVSETALLDRLRAGNDVLRQQSERQQYLMTAFQLPDSARRASLLVLDEADGNGACTQADTGSGNGRRGARHLQLVDNAPPSCRP